LSDQQFLTHTLSNGLSVVAEKMPGVRSAAMALLVPCGASADPHDRLGTANVLAELVMRGAGDRDSKQLTDHLDTLGLQRSSSAAVLYTRFGAAAMAANVLQGLDAYADLVRRARLPENDFEPARDLALQSLSGIDDDPRQKLMIKLREIHWPWPFGRNPMGDKTSLQALTLPDVQRSYQTRYTPAGAIFAIAGDIDLHDIRARAERLFGDWQPTQPVAPQNQQTQRRYHFEQQTTEQTHIGRNTSGLLSGAPGD
jgi:predicted Zn-dependent peptidase